MRWYDRLILGLIAMTIFAGGALAAGETKFRDSILFYDGFGAKFGDAGDAFLRWDGTDLDLVAAADNSMVTVGDGTTSWDLDWTGAASTDGFVWDASASELDFAGTAYVRTRTIVTAKTADYPVTSADYGTVFTNRGDAGAIIFTLPAPAAGNSGDWVEFYGIVDEDLTLTTAAGEQICTFNNATADSVGWAQTGEQIGSGFRAISDGTSWIVAPLANEAATMTVTDS
jgi:hypothetical protein